MLAAQHDDDIYTSVCVCVCVCDSKIQTYQSQLAVLRFHNLLVILEYFHF